MAHFFLSWASTAMYDSWPILSPIKVYLGCFQFEAIIKKATVNITVQVLRGPKF